jgi:hypothetical protein
MIKIPLQHTATAIICCEEMMAYDEFVLFPSSDPYEWIVSTVDYWERIQQELKRLLIQLQTPISLQNAMLYGAAENLYRTGNELLLSERIILNSKNCVGYVRVSFTG